MTWAVVSDIHGNLPALQAVVADAGAVDGWINLGDILSGPLWPAQTADWLMARERRGWITIAGNHERQVLTQALERMSATDRHTAQQLGPEHRAWLQGLPPTLRPAPGLLCVHGTPGSDVVYWLETVTPQGLREATDAEASERAAGVHAELVLCGHTHLPRDRMVHRTIGPIRVVNPGSVGLPAFDDDHQHVHVVENGSPHARYAVVERHAAGWQVQLRQVTYDWEAAARQAEHNGRGDWADALRTGRVGRTEAQLLAGSA
jgi:predicted phosphodiesterase